MKRAEFLRNLRKGRNVKPYQSKYGPLLGTLLSGLDMWLSTFGFTMPFTLNIKT
ncbi:MAG: hypothetical protein CM15mP29_2000 [Alphaproteobacteria bacterium]|nr:MAG: hypothetical protein CM15mP29_2000 [Alphaproteobacteria bacterium]